MHGRDKIVANQFVHMAGAKSTSARSPFSRRSSWRGRLPDHSEPRKSGRFRHFAKAVCAIRSSSVWLRAGTIGLLWRQHPGIWLQAFHYKLQGIRNIPWPSRPPLVTSITGQPRLAEISAFSSNSKTGSLPRKIRAYAQHEIVGLEQFLYFWIMFSDKQVAGSLLLIMSRASACVCRQRHRHIPYPA